MKKTNIKYMEEQQMTRRKRRLLAREAREKTHGKTRRVHIGHVVGLLVMVGIVGGIIYGLRSAGRQGPPPETYTASPIHWHAKIEMAVCDQTRTLPGPTDGSMGGPDELHHHHGDGIWHMEGRILRREDIALGTFFDAMKIPFDRDRFFEKKNGDECTPGHPGQVKLFVNGVANDQFRDFVGDYTPNAQDNVIRVVFE